MSDSPEDIVKRLRFYAETTDPSQHPTARGFFRMAANLIEKLVRGQREAARPKKEPKPSPEPEPPKRHGKPIPMMAVPKSVWVLYDPQVGPNHIVRVFLAREMAVGYILATMKRDPKFVADENTFYPIVQVPFDTAGF